MVAETLKFFNTLEPLNHITHAGLKKELGYNNNNNTHNMSHICYTPMFNELNK